jgi:two-component system OmpR family sensor kinase
MVMAEEWQSSAEARIATTLQQLLAIGVEDTRAALDQAATLLASALGADKIDFFLYEADKDTLAAVGTSQTPMGKKQQALGLDRLPVSLGGLAARVFTSGQPCYTGHAEDEPDELRPIVEQLGVRSELLVPLAGRRGVFSAVSAEPDAFGEADATLANAAAGWVRLLLERAELLERVAAEAERRGRRAAAEELARLTGREQEVAAAAAEGLTNHQIGRRLTLEEGTVANHLARILRKLGLASRTQLAVWAVERGLYRSDWAEENGEGLTPQT